MSRKPSRWIPIWRRVIFPGSDLVDALQALSSREAVQAYKRALELNSNLDEAHHQLGFVYLHIGLLDKGWQEIEKALAINPGNSLARYRLGVIDMCRGKYEEAFRSSTALRSKRALRSWRSIHPRLYSGWDETRKLPR